MTALADEHTALDAGDRAWCAGDRGEAAAQWRVAAEGTPAVEAMAELRLLLVTGNVGLAIHGPRIDRALASCETGAPWCEIARADYEILLLELGLPGDADEARRRIERAEDALPGPALARRVWMGEAPVQALSSVSRDGLGDGILQAGGWPRGPGSWFVGLGLSGAPGLGIGGGLRLVHPDLRYQHWRLTADATLTSRRTGQLSAQLATPGTVWSVWSLRGGRLVLDNYALDQTITLWTLNALAGPGLRWGKSAAWFGPLLRVDHHDGERLDGHGLSAGFSRTSPSLRLSGRVEQTLGADYPHTLLSGSATAGRSLGSLGVYGRLAGAMAPRSQAPWWRLPAAGGGVHLRSAPMGRWRGPALLSSTIEVRRALLGSLSGVVFAEGAWIDGVHPGAGLGLRLHLPPRPHATLRLDVGLGEEGIHVTAGWGEAL